MSRSIFQIPNDAPTSNPFAAVGLRENPFPVAGEGLALYADHAEEEFAKIEKWVETVGRATSRWMTRADAIPPLALTGPHGSGKTHVIKRICASQVEQVVPSARISLANSAFEGIPFSEMLIRNFPLNSWDGVPGVKFVRSILARAAERGPKEIARCVDVSSPVSGPLHRAARGEIDADAAHLLCEWLLRNPISTRDSAKLGLPHDVCGGTTAVTAVVDLMRAARQLGLMQVWVVAFDELETLWQRGAVSAERIEFLRGLSRVVDCAVNGGAPIAVIVAWRQGGEIDVDEIMKRDYLTLRYRLGDPVVFPELPREHVWPFAKMFLDRVGVGEESAFVKTLKGVTGKIYEEARREAERAGCPATPAFVLNAWRREALRVAEFFARNAKK